MRMLSGESWLGLMREMRKKKGVTVDERSTIGVLTFEVASYMSKAVNLWRSLSQEQIARLGDEVLRLEGVRKLVSNDDNFLLGLALAETMDSVDSLAHSVTRLCKRCSDPVLQRFDHVFADLIMNDSDLYGLLYSGKKMEREVRKLEKFVAAGANLYQELEILAELEQGLRRMEMNAEISRQGNSFLDFKQKVVWQRQAVKCLRDASVWNRTYDYTVRLLARSLFTIVDRIKLVFGFQQKDTDTFSKTRNHLSRSNSVSGVIQSSIQFSNGGALHRFASDPIKISGHIALDNGVANGRRRGTLLRSPTRIKWPVSSKSFKGCMIGEGNNSPVLDGDITKLNRSSGDGTESAESEHPMNIFDADLPPYIFKSWQKLLNAPPSTLGSAALSLHYANVIIVIEKLAASPHLIGNDARDDLYGMLPRSIRMALRIRLKSYAMNLSLSVYDPDLAADWTDAIGKILDWLSPLAYNMIKWQSDRNFEQHHLVSSTNVLLLQTLYYANQGKTEAAITELLVGLNYLWRYAKELNEKAILECTSS
ncbi:hypothetical protein KFK09_009473 [Dendrobium nobile]|uniref:Uncharacterized protein n=1 Tax=Dendrobium nobile TaxID=94219 RepID=A0A8T3BJF7_DENNO|nr:hypothetical protein KFK09_009473 [Dendrobium nobile]